MRTSPVALLCELRTLSTAGLAFAMFTAIAFVPNFARADPGTGKRCAKHLVENFPDPSKVEIYAEQCKAGVQPDCIRLARIKLEHECEWDEGMRILHESCDGQGYPGGCYGLAMYYIMNGGDTVEAAKLLTDTCQAGLDAACQLRGIQLAREGLAHQAELYFNIACLRGDTISCERLFNSTRARGDDDATVDYVWKACTAKVDYMCGKALQTLGSIDKMELEYWQNIRHVFKRVCEQGLIESCLLFVEYAAPRFPADARAARDAALAADPDAETRERLIGLSKKLGLDQGD